MKRLTVMICVLVACCAWAQEEDLNRRIQQHRMGTLIVEAQPGPLCVSSRFGMNSGLAQALSSSPFAGWMSAEDQRKYKETFLANFNAAVDRERCEVAFDGAAAGRGGLPCCRCHPGLDGRA